MPKLREKTPTIVKVGEEFSKRQPCFKIEVSEGQAGDGGFVMLRNHVKGKPRVQGDVALELHLVDQIGSAPQSGVRGDFHLAELEAGAKVSVRVDGRLNIDAKGISQEQLAAVLKYAQSLGEILASEFGH